MRHLACSIVLAVLVAGCGGGGAAGGDCDGLDLATCRTTDGCRPDLCDGCSCEPTYRGCLGVDQTPEECPALGCASPDCCGGQAECTAGSCAPPGTAPGCGACNPDPGACIDDATCKAIDPTMICEPIACTCDASRTCVAGCVDDTTCDDGTTCDPALARCVAQTCGPAAACPDDFDCVEQRCARRTCTDDLVCDGYCVDGACYAARGVCQLPVP